MAAIEVDVAVIGGGSGGYAAARTAVSRGLTTAVVDGAAQLGGLCILRGCMPTKALLHAAEVYHQIQRSQVWGLRAGEVGYDFARVMERKDRLIGDFAAYRQQQLTEGKFQLLRAPARFLDPHTLDLGPAGTLRARAFVIATGSVQAPAPLPALDQADCLNSDAALELKQLPKSMVVLGGGAVAIEFAQFFGRFGVQVCVVQRSSRLLKDFDPDAGAVVESVFRKEGIQVYTGTRLLDAGRDGQGKFVEFEHEGQRRRIQAEEIFNGLGRAPNTAHLNLEAAGVTLERGRIVTDDTMQTSAPHIFAAGDCTGPYELVHLAVTQGEVAGANLLAAAPTKRMDYRLLTFVVFSDPQVATVGLTEEEARRRGIAYLAASYPFHDHGKSLIMEALDGQVKLLADPKTGEILGGACVGPGGGDLIHEIVVAMAARMTVQQLAAVPHYHPTLAEIWTYPAEDLASQISG
jgi:pyruvate/2-oxoglutarate dehydrogenase complex dihydrolipoamide dehydrogenase (E3) component